MDICRLQHHNAQDNTCYSPVHLTYSRTDCFFISQALVEDVVESTIEPDHTPITLSLSVCKQPPQNQRWILNENILWEEVAKTQLQAELSIFFELNDTGGIRPLLVWEAHKCYIRGSLIKLGSKHKKITSLKVEFLNITRTPY